MSGFALVWGKMLHSSLWVQESKETRLLWVTMLMMKDSEGVVQASLVGLADAAKITVEECRESLGVLMSPDPNDTSKVEGGVRVREVAGGWEIVNHDLYRFSTEAKREFWRKTKAEQRARSPKAKRKAQNVPRGTPLAGERAYEEALKRGDVAGAQAILDEQPVGKIPQGSVVKSITNSVPSEEQAAAGVVGFTETVLQVPMSISSASNEEAKVNMPPVARNYSSDPDNPDPVPERAENQPIPEISSGPVYPVQEDVQQVESGRFVDGEWVPD